MGHVNTDKAGLGTLLFRRGIFLEVCVTNKALLCGVDQLHLGTGGGSTKCGAGGSFLPVCVRECQEAVK